jgi:DNA-directed RNA polymerase specialized sigma subunit
LSENLKAEIDRLSSIGENNTYLEQLVTSTILTNDDWVQFRIVFEKVHPNFINEQKLQFPDLTQAELRYLVLEKLQLSTKEMANMLGVSDGAIRQIKSRLKLKIQ